MIIECPACGARAQLPDSKAGAKVRCVECERVYLARAAGSRAPVKSRSSALPVAIGAGVVVLIIALFALSNRGKRAQPVVVEETKAPEPAPVVDATGWDSPLVKFTRKVHDMASARDEVDLQNVLAEDRVWARVKGAENGEEVDPAGYANLDDTTRLTFVDGVLSSMTADDPENLVGAWVPFDGGVIEETDDAATVRLTLHPRDAATAGTRHIEWLLVKGPRGWRAWSWERWFSPEELDAARVAQASTRKKRTLSDGSVVLEAETKKVEYMPETTPEERARIEGLIAQMLDFTTRPAPRTQAGDELRAIGKPAIPGLLNKLYELDQAGWDDVDSASRGKLVHNTLQDITGYVTTFNPHEALGGTDERRESGVRQWFYWYDKRFAKFEARPEETDLLEENFQPKTETEKREYEKYKKLQEQEEAERKP